MTQAINFTYEELEALFVLTREARVKYPDNAVLSEVNKRFLTALIQATQSTLEERVR